jgi:hypothetical protein
MESASRRCGFTKVVGAYYVLNGVSMVTIWSILLATDEVPELHTQFVYLMFHLSAESLTALFSIITGFWLIAGRELAKILYYFTTGLFVSAGILALGRYVFESDIFNWAMVFMLSGLNLIAATFLAVSFHVGFSTMENRYDKFAFLTNGGLCYSLINLAGFMADKGTGYAYGYMGFTLLMATAVVCLTAVKTSRILKA